MNDLERINESLTAASRTFSPQIRQKYASAGVAMSDGSFPIPDKGALHRAIQSLGRAHPSRMGLVKAHIIARAKALNAVSELPASWNVKDS